MKEELSNCCQAPVEGGEGIIKDYVCTVCKEHCDLETNQNKNESTKSIQNKRGNHPIQRK